MTFYHFFKTNQILSNIRNGKTEDGRRSLQSAEDKNDSFELWSDRRLRILYSLANCAISQKVKTFYSMHRLLVEWQGREVWQKGKAQYRWPHCSNFRSAPFYIENITKVFSKQASLLRRSTVLSLPPSVSIPWTSGLVINTPPYRKLHGERMPS
jgi:hypothetical protein